MTSQSYPCGARPSDHAGHDAQHSVGEQPRRVQLSRAKGWRMPPNTVKVDRSTRYGNPWPIGEWGPLDRKALDAEGAVGLFEQMLDDPDMRAAAGYPEDLSPLLGMNLACWCSLDRPCHVDPLLKRANPAKSSAGQPSEASTSCHTRDEHLPSLSAVPVQKGGRLSSQSQPCGDGASLAPSSPQAQHSDGRRLCEAFAETFEGGGWADAPSWDDFDARQQARWDRTAQLFLRSANAGPLEVEADEQ